MNARLKKALLSERFWSFVIFFIFFVLYLSEIPSLNVGYADSDLFLTLGKNLGLAHPPGYPLYVLLLNLFGKIPLPFTYVFKANLLSTILHSFTLVFIFRALLVFGNFIERKKVGAKNYILIFVAVTCLGANFLFFQNAIIAEKYALNNLFASILLFWFCQFYFESKKNGAKILALFGLALSYHHSILLISPSIFFVVIKEFLVSKKVTLKKLGVFFITYLAGISLLFFLNRLDKNASWHFENSLKSTVNYITKNYYKGINDVTGKNTNEYLKSLDVNKLLEELPEQVNNFKQQNGLIFGLFFIIGFWLVWKKFKPFGKKRKEIELGLLALIITSFVTIFVIPFYFDWSPNFFVQLVSMRQFMLGYLLVPFFVLYFLIKVFEKLKKSKVVFLITIFVLSLVRIIETKRKIDYKNFNFVHDQYEYILNQLDKDSLIVCGSDISCFGLLYLQEVEDIRSDVIVVPMSTELVSDRLYKIKDLKGYSYEKPPFTIIDIISWNLGKKKVYAIDLSKNHRVQLGMNYGFLRYIPLGYFGEIVRYFPTSSYKYSYNFEENLRKNVPLEDKHKLYLISLSAYNHIFNSISFAKLQQSQLAKSELKLIDRNSLNNPELLAFYNKTNLDINNVNAFTEYVPGVTNPSEEQILALADFFVEERRFDLAYFGYLGVLLRNPKSENGRIKFAQFNVIIGEKKQAEIEYRNALKYYPDNEEAKKWLEEN